MIIETWVAAILFIAIGVMGIILGLCLLSEQNDHKKTREELGWAKEEIAELKRYISVQRAKNVVNVANDFYNESGKKK